ncbi:MAG: ATP-binding protein, partial [Armatimonadota bacterium]|nr:ATP-binding protein [Armatimonadota bacterium]
AEEIARSAGMDEEKVSRLIVSIGEAATNALKHSGGGTVSIHQTPNSLIAVVSDKGHGIAALSLPDIALTKGYSTAGSLGMGYKVMISFSDRIYLATGPEGTKVGIEMKLSDMTSEAESAKEDVILKCEAGTRSETES